MNERAVELYKEACEFAYGVCKEEGRTGGPSDHIWHTLSTGRFAELIVRECANMLDEDSYLMPELGGYAHDMRQRFGVE